MIRSTLLVLLASLASASAARADTVADFIGGSFEVAGEAAALSASQKSYQYRNGTWWCEIYKRPKGVAVRAEVGEKLRITNAAYTMGPLTIGTQLILKFSDARFSGMKCGTVYGYPTVENVKEILGSAFAFHAPGDASRKANTMVAEADVEESSVEAPVPN